MAVMQPFFLLFQPDQDCVKIFACATPEKGWFGSITIFDGKRRFIFFGRSGRLAQSVSIKDLPIL